MDDDIQSKLKVEVFIKNPDYVVRKVLQAFVHKEIPKTRLCVRAMSDEDGFCRQPFKIISAGRWKHENTD